MNRESPNYYFQFIRELITERLVLYNTDAVIKLTMLSLSSIIDIIGISMMGPENYFLYIIIMDSIYNQSSKTQQQSAN